MPHSIWSRWRITASNIILMIEKLNENNIEVIGVELGSELSNRSYFSNGYTSNPIRCISGTILLKYVFVL